MMRPRILVVSLVVVAIALLAMLWGSTYSVPDLVRVDYGLPLRWGSNTLDTIAGPVDRWSVDMMSLAVGPRLLVRDAVSCSVHRLQTMVGPFISHYPGYSKK